MANYGRELRIEVDIRKNNRVCEKNKESTRENWSSIKKIAEENKVTSR